MKKMLLIILICIFDYNFSYSQISTNQMEYNSAQFEMKYVQPLIGDTLIASKVVMIKKGSNEFRLDSINYKIYIIKKLRFTVYVGNKNNYIYSGNEIVEYDYLKYRSDTDYEIYEIVDGIEKKINKMCFNVASEYYSRGNINRRFVVCYSHNSGFEMLNFMFVN